MALDVVASVFTATSSNISGQINVSEVFLCF